MTPTERARERFDIRVGDAVTFEFAGVPRAGVVNRIERRATVLVPSPDGTRYTDGERYAKFYVPVAMLRKRS